MRIVSSLAIFVIPLMLSIVLFFPSNMLSAVKANTSIGSYQNTSNFVSYQDATLGIKFQYPEDWKKIVHYSANNSRIEFISPLQSQFEIFPPSESYSTNLQKIPRLPSVKPYVTATNLSIVVVQPVSGTFVFYPTANEKPLLRIPRVRCSNALRSVIRRRHP